MRLTELINRYYIYAILTIFLMVGPLLYFFTGQWFDKQILERLKNEKIKVMQNVQKHNLLTNFYPYSEVYLGSNEEKKQNDLATELLYDPVENRSTPYLSLRFTISHNGNVYIGTVRHSLHIKGRFQNAVAFALLSLLLLILLSFLVIIGKQKQKIWQPFFSSIQDIREYQLTRKGHFSFADTHIIEFKELNAIIQDFIDTNKRDYTTLQEFTENSVHELQTPLAIINSNIENLLQSQNFTKEQLESLANVSSAAGRLSKLNHGLSLLAKIENLQFSDTKEIIFADQIRLLLKDFEDIISFKEIQMNIKLNNTFKVAMNESLAIILVTNLLKNAIRYNLTGGSLQIIESERVLIFKNSGEELKVHPDQLFGRFRKDSNNQQGKSLGLGLAIVKKICENYHLAIKYTYKKGQHTVKLIKPQ